MKLSTGKISLPLQFDNGDVEYILINPHSEGLMDRIKNFETSIKKRLEKVNLERYKDAFSNDVVFQNLNFAKMMELPPEELNKITLQSEALDEIDKLLEKEFCEEIDAIFESDVSSKAFKYVPPLALIADENGEYEIYLIQVLTALGEELQKYGGKFNDATNKYIAKYPKHK